MSIFIKIIIMFVSSAILLFLAILEYRMFKRLFAGNGLEYRVDRILIYSIGIIVVLLIGLWRIL